MASPELPMVSIVIPSHFRKDLLDKLLQSLSQQTYPHDRIEIIVVPTPNDGSERVIAYRDKKMDISLKLMEIPNDPSGGKDVSAKRNFGVKQAKGDWIGFVDDDCIADKDWIAAASCYFSSPFVGGIEGLTSVPKASIKTLTNKGLQRLSEPGGYQSCNIFYQRSTFLEVGGFSDQFPWYLEDTDLAWSVLDANQEISFCQKAIVYHPNKEPATWRLIHEAKGAILKPLLYKRHPKIYHKTGTKTLRNASYAYLIGYLGILLGLIGGSGSIITFSFFYLLFLGLVQLTKQFWGCHFTWHEITSTYFFLILVPPITLIQLVRGSFKNKCRLGELFFLLKP